MSSPTPPRPARSPSAKALFRRLILLAMLLAFMLFSVYWAAQEQHWYWLTGPHPLPPP